jgi:hypothetical protein
MIVKPDGTFCPDFRLEQLGRLATFLLEGAGGWCRQEFRYGALRLGFAVIRRTEASNG